MCLTVGYCQKSHKVHCLRTVLSFAQFGDWKLEMKVPAWLGVRSTSRMNFRDREKWGDWPRCLILSFFLRNFTVWGPQSRDITAFSEPPSKTSSHWRLCLSTLILESHCISVIIFQTLCFISLCYFRKSTFDDITTLLVVFLYIFYVENIVWRPHIT